MENLDHPQTRLAVKAAAQVREAMIKRDNQQKDAVDAYDRAVLGGDKSEIAQAAMIMMVTVGMVDPVRDALQHFASVARLLSTAEEDVN